MTKARVEMFAVTTRFHWQLLKPEQADSSWMRRTKITIRNLRGSHPPPPICIVPPPPPPPPPRPTPFSMPLLLWPLFHDVPRPAASWIIVSFVAAFRLHHCAGQDERGPCVHQRGAVNLKCNQPIKEAPADLSGSGEPRRGAATGQPGSGEPRRGQPRDSQGVESQGGGSYGTASQWRAKEGAAMGQPGSGERERGQPWGSQGVESQGGGSHGTAREWRVREGSAREWRAKEGAAREWRAKRWRVVNFSSLPAGGSKAQSDTITFSPGY